MKFRKLVWWVCFWLISFLAYSFPSAGNEKEIEEAWGKGNRLESYSFGIEYKEAKLYLTFYQTIQNIEITLLSDLGTMVYQCYFSAVKGEMYTIDLTGYEETLSLQIQLSDGRRFVAYY